jgi:hypothetical protein
VRSVAGSPVANAQPTPAPPPAPTVVEAPELEDSAECAGGVDTDNIQEGDENGPEEPDDCAPCTARTLRMLL